jgi:two-component system, NarL family, response regulator LiaR
VAPVTATIDDDGTRHGDVGVLVVDADPLVRRTLGQALSSDPDLEVMETGSASDAVALVREHHPHVVVMNVDMPDLDGVSATVRLHRHVPEARVLLLSAVPDPELGMLALRAGAAGFLGKDTDQTALIRAVRGVARGEAAISRALTGELVATLRRAPQRPPGMRPVQSPLTTREWEVLDLIAGGASTEEVAERLFLSIDTVRSHIKHILSKLGAHSRAEAIQFASTWRPPGSVDHDAADEAPLRDLVDRLLERLRGGT